MPLPFYRCSKCRLEYNSYDAAEACENSHVTVVSAKENKYTRGKYPFTIAVTFSNGECKTYILEDLVHTL